MTGQERVFGFALPEQDRRFVIHLGSAASWPGLTWLQSREEAMNRRGRSDEQVAVTLPTMPGISVSAADAYSLFKKAKKARTYGKLVKESIDENTRPGALMKLGIRGMLDIVGKALGTSLTSHPYFAFHKVHLEALAQALNASSNLDAAREALNRAIRSADASASLTGVLEHYQSRKNALKLTYTVFIAGSLTLLRDRGTNPQAARQISSAGHTPESLQALTDQNIYEWRAKWCELLLDSAQLLAMAEMELRATEAAMTRFNEKMKALAAGGLMGRGVFGPQMEEERRWQQVDRALRPNADNPQAVEDPVGYTRKQVDAIERVSDTLGEGCEVAMSDDAYRPETIFLLIGKL